VASPKKAAPSGTKDVIVDIATNRKALRDYTILARYEAGMELRGTEVKSIRNGKLNISDAFARIEKNQVWLYNCDVQAYDKASWEQHEPRRTRRLLLHKREIYKLIGYNQVKGLALPVLRAYWKNQRVKVELGVGQGKTKGDQRQDLKAKQDNREAQRVAAAFNKRKSGA
jgi:SsrA-binding protein